MVFVAASGPKVPANTQYPVASRASGDGPDTAQYGLVWPNEWPNGETRARDDELAPPAGGAGNHRNGWTAKTVQTELGPVAVRTRRDRQGTFEPRLVGKRQMRLAGLDEKVLGLYAVGMTVRDIATHLSDLYGVEVGRDLAVGRAGGDVVGDFSPMHSIERPRAARLRSTHAHPIARPRRLDRCGHRRHR